MTSLRKTIGERVKAIRRSKGWTQEQLGEKAQLKNTYIGDIERGTRNVSIDSIERVINALGVGIYEFFDFTYPSLDDKKTELATVLEVHQSYLRKRDVEEVKSIHRIAKDILETIDTKKRS
jgi:transcriptional regulator with XRE-family HTH domain